MPHPYAPPSNALAMAVTLPSLALECFAAELRGAPVWALPYRTSIAVFKTLWGSACMPATFCFGHSQVRFRAAFISELSVLVFVFAVGALRRA